MVRVKYTRGYVTVRIPEALAEEIDAVLQSGVHGYRSRAEVANEAIRLRLEELHRYPVLKRCWERELEAVSK